jgi:hypothetical protein
VPGRACERCFEKIHLLLRKRPLARADLGLRPPLAAENKGFHADFAARQDSLMVENRVPA